MANEIAKVDAALATIGSAVRQLGEALGNMSDEEVPRAYELVNQMVKNMDLTKTHIRDRLLLYLNVHGRTVTEKGSKEAVIGDSVVRAQPQRTGLDPKALEKTLRAKGMQPADHMQSTVTYKVDPLKAQLLVAKGQLTEQDIKASSYPAAYTIRVTPRQKVGPGETNQSQLMEGESYGDGE